MKNVLIIAYYFPPMGGSGVQRTLKFVRYLPEFGWMPTVLTIKPYMFHGITDPALLQELPPEVEVVRCYSLEYRRLRVLSRAYRENPRLPQRGSFPPKGVRDVPAQGALNTLMHSAAFMRDFVFVPDYFIGWLPFAILGARHVVRRKRLDAIYSSFPPPTAHLIANILKRRYSIPWVADFRDPWACGEYTPFRSITRLHRKVSQAMESSSVHSCDKLIVAVPSSKEQFLQAYPTLPEDKIYIITNGFDEADFQQVDVASAGGFTLAYVGTTHIDELEPFLSALSIIKEKNPKELEQWQVRFVGRVNSSIAMRAEELGIGDMMHYTGYVSHKEAIKELLGASALLVTRSQRDAHGGKVFEYLRARKPILALCPSGGELARLIEGSGSGVAVPFDDPTSIATALRQLCLDCAEECNKYRVGDSFMAQYQRRELTKRLAGVFDEVSA